MKLVLVTEFPADPESPHGGVESVSVNLTRALAALPDLEVEVVTYCGGKEEREVFDWCGARIHRLSPPSGSMFLSSIGSARREISEYVAALVPDVIHAHDTYGIMVREQKCPVLFTVHGFIHGDIIVSKSRFRWLRAKLWKKIETDSWADQQAIVSISPYVRERLQQYTKAKIFDIDNPVDESFFELQAKPQPHTIFCAAAICNRKNTMGLVKAIKAMVDRNIEVELRWAGPVTEEDYMHGVQRYIEQHNLQRHVSFLGQITSSEIKEELQQAGVFALVSFEENSPMGIEEAMAVGVPVVTSSRCGMPYMVDHGVSGYLVDPNDTDEIAGCLAAVVGNPENRARLSQGAIETAQRRFRGSVVARKTAQVYAQLISPMSWASN